MTTTPDATPSEATTPANSLLDGVRILEIAHPLTEHAGRLFAGLGAEVLLIEPPGGALTRHRLPRLPNADDNDRGSIAFLARNANKHSVVIDPNDAGDLALLADLVVRSHLIIDADSSVFHSAIATMTGDASRVILTDEYGLGTSSIVGFAASGGMACSGWPGQPPVNAASWMAADGASIYAAMMGAVGLFVANRHGVRLDYEIPYNEAAIRTIAPWSRHLHAAGVNVAGQGVNPGRQGFGPYPVFATTDGFIKIVIATPRQLGALLELMGRPADLCEGVWADPAFRRDNIDAFYMMCGEYLNDRSTDELFHHGQNLGLTITPLNTLRQFRDDAHAESRGLFIAVEDPDFGPLEMMRAPMIAEPSSLTPDYLPAPALGSGNGRARDIVAEPAYVLTPTGDQVDPLRPLADLRLLQLGSGAVVPEACMDFALLGCDVLRVESMVNPDFLRRGGIDGDLDASATFNQLNLGVRSLTIDMRQDEATQIVRKLLPTCDAVVENMRAPVVENWGFDYDACREIQPDVISLSSQGFGRGPYGHYQSFGPNLSAYCGAASQWAHPTDDVPVGGSIPHPDHVAGKQAYVALLAALRRRDQGGGGCSIEAAQVEAPAYLIADRFLSQQFNAEDLPPDGNVSLDVAPHGCYPCLDDEWITLAADTDEQWRSLAALIDEPWVHDAALKTNAGRLSAPDLDARLGEWSEAFAIDDVEAALRASGVPSSRVVNSNHMASGPGNERGGIFAEVDHPAAGRLAMTGLPVVTPDGRRPAVLRSPLMGEHTDEIVSELAGCDPQVISDLRSQNVLGY